MKKLFHIFLALTLCTVAFTSCLGDDEADNGVTYADMDNAMKAMGGTYTGNLLYSTDLNGIPDTIKNIRVRVDSVITILNFPPSSFAAGLTMLADSTLRSDIGKLEATALKCYVGFYNVSTSGSTINVMPENVTFTSRVGSEAYSCKVPFLNGDSNSAGVYSVSAQQLVFRMFTYGLLLNDKAQGTSLFEPIYYQYVSTSKY